MAILCDDKSFRFYRFVDNRSANVSPQLFLGEFPNGDREISIDDISLKDIDLQTIYRKLGRICDTLYYVFLSGYQSRLEAYWKYSVEKWKAQGKGIDSSPMWHKATVQAKRAIEEAISAWNLYGEGKLDESMESGDRAAQFLAERYVSRCPSVVAMNANSEFLITASGQLLLCREVIFSRSPKTSMIYDISKGNMARLT